VFTASNSTQNYLLAGWVTKPRVVGWTGHTGDQYPLAFVGLLQCARFLFTRGWLEGGAGERLRCSCRVGWILGPVDGLLGSHHIDVIQTSQVVKESGKVSHQLNSLHHVWIKNYNLNDSKLVELEMNQAACT
jgi:hypothetical protein